MKLFGRYMNFIYYEYGMMIPSIMPLLCLYKVPHWW